MKNFYYLILLMAVCSTGSVLIWQDQGIIEENELEQIESNESVEKKQELRGIQDELGSEGVEKTPQQFDSFFRDLETEEDIEKETSSIERTPLDLKPEVITSVVIAGEKKSEQPAAAKSTVSEPESTESENSIKLRPEDFDWLNKEDSPQDLSSLLPGVVSRSARGNNPEPENPDETEDGLEEIDSQEEWYTGHTRGYAMLYLMQPGARQTVEAQVNAILESRLKDLYLGVLTDGTFGLNFSYLANVVKRLNEGDRRLTLVLYLSNGSTMRKYDSTPITAAFARVEPRRFRDLIKYDPVTREQYRQLVSNVKSIYELNRSLNSGNRNVAVPMLEDNLRVESYRAMRAIAGTELGTLVAYVRNPCQGCYSGNDSDPAGDGLELHGPNQISALSASGGYTLDGQGYSFAGERGIAVSDVFYLLESAYQQQTGYFGLWRFERQGLQRSSSVHPDARSYEVPTPEQIQIEIELLRHGLPLERLEKD